jgi:hypothetical protein
VTETPRLPDPADGADAKQHGDPLLASAQGRNDGDDGSRHGVDATGSARDSGPEDPADGVA